MFKPTDQQQRILSAFQKGKSFSVHAFAGTGKTTTIVHLAKNAPSEKRGLYFVFNKSLQEHAAGEMRMLHNMEKSTVHSRALRWAKAQYKYTEGKLTDQPAYKHFLKTPDIIRLPDQLKTSLSNQIGDDSDVSRYVVRAILGIIKAFCQSGDREIEAKHLRQLDPDFPPNPKYKEILLKNEEFFLNAAIQGWENMENPDGKIPLGFDGFLKLWSLSNPKLDYDFLFVDEAQDFTPAMQKVIDDYPRQKVLFMDAQQQVNSWRGAAVNRPNAQSSRKKEENADGADNSIFLLTTTYRFGNQLAKIANNILRFLGVVENKITSANDSGTKIVEAGKEDIADAPPNAYLFRQNLSLMMFAFSLFKDGKRYHIIDRHRQINKIVNDYKRLNDGEWGESRFFMWYNSWEDAVNDSSNAMKGTQIESWVSFLENHNPAEVLKCVNCSEMLPGDAYPSLSTVHRAKGLEWDTVQLDSDLMIEKNESDDKKNEEESEELRILYVALTRAKKTLLLPKSILDFCQS